MTASLLDLLNREKELVDEINDYDKILKELEEQRKRIEDQRRLTDAKLANIRSILVDYIDTKLVKIPEKNLWR